MTTYRSRILLALLVATTTTGAAWSVDFIRIVPEGPSAPRQHQIRHAVVPAQQFDLWVFGRHLTDHELDESLEQSLESYLDSVDGVCKFSAHQRAKLKLAGAGDILAFTRRLDDMRKKFKNADQNQIGNMWQQIQPLKQAYDTGIFSKEALVKKVMRTYLDSEQTQRLAKVEKQRCKFMHHAMILQFVSHWDAVQPLKAEQRVALVALLLQQTRPLESVPSSANLYLYDYYLMREIERIEEEELEHVLGEEAWTKFAAVMKQGARMQLNQQGFVPAKEDQE